MCIIYTGNEEDIIYVDGMVFELKEHYYNGKLIAYNLYLQNTLVESYDSVELGIMALKVLIKKIASGHNYIDIEDINMIIEA